MIKLFSDIKQGEWFREVSGSRILVKLHNVLPSGCHQSHMRFVVSKDKPEVKPSSIGMPFNSVDTDGITGFCPSWVEFDVIPKPFSSGR